MNKACSNRSVSIASSPPVRAQNRANVSNGIFASSWNIASSANALAPSLSNAPGSPQW